MLCSTGKGHYCRDTCNRASLPKSTHNLTSSHSFIHLLLLSKSIIFRRHARLLYFRKASFVTRQIFATSYFAAEQPQSLHISLISCLVAAFCLRKRRSSCNRKGNNCNHCAKGKIPSQNTCSRLGQVQFISQLRKPLFFKSPRFQTDVFCWIFLAQLSN